MNEVFIEVYLAKKMPLGSFGPYGLGRREFSLDEIITGDPVQREENREKYVSEQIDQHMKKVLSI